MRSKWEWIADACRKLGYEEAAGIADEIETVLKDIYGDTKTIAWMRDYIGIKYRNLYSIHSINIWNIAGIVEYCIACMEEALCENCRFKEHAGSCSKSGSLYTKFFEALSRDERRRR